MQPGVVTGSDGVDVAKTVYPSLGPILSAFGHGAKDGWGDDPIGLPTDAVKWLSDKGVFGPEKGGYQNPFQAFNELLAHTVVGAAQIVGRAGSAALGSYQAGVIEGLADSGIDIDWVAGISIGAASMLIVLPTPEDCISSTWRSPPSQAPRPIATPSSSVVSDTVRIAGFAWQRWIRRLCPASGT